LPGFAVKNSAGFIAGTHDRSDADGGAKGVGAKCEFRKRTS